MHRCQGSSTPNVMINQEKCDHLSTHSQSVQNLKHLQTVCDDLKKLGLSQNCQISETVNCHQTREFKNKYPESDYHGQRPQSGGISDIQPNVQEVTNCQPRNHEQLEQLFKNQQRKTVHECKEPKLNGIYGELGMIENNQQSTDNVNEQRYEKDANHQLTTEGDNQRKEPPAKVNDQELETMNIHSKITVMDKEFEKYDHINGNCKSSSEFSDVQRLTSCSSDEASCDVFTSSSQDDAESSYAESFSTNQGGSESNYGGSTSSTQDDFEMPSTFQVVNCSQVQIGSTINFNYPVNVTENCVQNLPLQSMFSNAQVNLFDGSTADVGSRVNYNGPVNITNIVKVDAIKYEEFERLAIENGNEVPSDLSDVDKGPRTTVKLINRRMWLAQPPLGSLERLQHPVPYVVILHTATEECLKQSECVFITRHIQNFHIEGNGWWDIGYSFLIGGDGNVYEGRGWDKIGAFAKGYNHLSIGIALIGTFTIVLPSEVQLRTLNYWIEEGVRLGKISPDYKILTHNQLSGSTSPGTAFVKLIKTWPRWSDTPHKD